MKRFLVFILTITSIYAYRVDGLSSGVNAEKKTHYLVRNGDYSNASTQAITMGLTRVMNGAEYFTYHKFIFGHDAEIMHYFTKKSHRLYKTVVSWSLNESGTAFMMPGVNSGYEKDKAKFIQKLRKLLSKKYKKVSKNLFVIDKYSTVKIKNDTTAVRLIYIDKRFIKKSKNEKEKFKKEKNRKEFNKALNDL